MVYYTVEYNNGKEDMLIVEETRGNARKTVKQALKFFGDIDIKIIRHDIKEIPLKDLIEKKEKEIE